MEEVFAPCMVELLDSPFQPLQMDAKFDALEELFIQIYGGGQASSMFQASVRTTAHDSAMIEPDPCLHGWNREHDHLNP